MIADDVYGYGAPVWQRFCDPGHKGRWDDATPGVRSAQSGTPAARSILRLQVKIEGRRIAEARFQAYGCPVTIAVGDWLAGQLRGAELARLSEIHAADIRQALEIQDDKAHCALMGEDVLQALIRTIESAA